MAYGSILGQIITVGDHVSQAQIGQATPSTHAGELNKLLARTFQEVK
jgi:hypothetical protein